MQTHDYVLVLPSRGKTPGIARIVSLHGNGSSQEAEILYDNGEKDRFYTALLYQNNECHQRRKMFLRERAAKIGNKKET